MRRREDEKEKEAKVQPVSGAVNHHSKTGWTNPGFADHDITSDNHSHCGNQRTDWRKVANEKMEDYLSRCPGGYGGNEQSSSKWQASKEWDPSMNVCYLPRCFKQKV